jgi:hypothetical protein
MTIAHPEDHETTGKFVFKLCDRFNILEKIVIKSQLFDDSQYSDQNLKGDHSSSKGGCNNGSHLYREEISRPAIDIKNTNLNPSSQIFKDFKFDETVFVSFLYRGQSDILIGQVFG